MWVTSTGSRAAGREARTPRLAGACERRARGFLWGALRCKKKNPPRWNPLSAPGASRHIQPLSVPVLSRHIQPLSIPVAQQTCYIERPSGPVALPDV
jgi:hypothetical protein